MNNLVQLFLEASKERFIKKLNLSDEDKQTLIDFCNKYPQYASRIDWNNKNLTMDDFKPIFDLANVSRSAVHSRIKDGDFAALFARGKFIIFKETDNWLYVLPMCYEDAKFMDSVACGGEGARWCIGWKDSDSHWLSYTTENESRFSSFVLAFNKRYNKEDFAGIPLVTRTSADGNDYEIPDPFNADYQDLAKDMKCLKYMIQILDDPEEQTDLYGAQEDNPDHLVWTQDDEPSNVFGLHEYNFELSDEEIKKIKSIFTKKFRSVDEDEINAMDPIICTADNFGEVIRPLKRNNENCPYKVILTGSLSKLSDVFSISKYLKISFSDDCSIASTVLNQLKQNSKVILDMSSLNTNNVKGVYDDLVGLFSEDQAMGALKTAKTLDYFFAYSTRDTVNLANIDFNNLEHARYTFFGCKIGHLDLSGCSFENLKTVVQCFNNAVIDTLDMTGVTIPESADLEDMFTKHKITSLITDNQRVQQAFDEA